MSKAGLKVRVMVWKRPPGVIPELSDLEGRGCVLKVFNLERFAVCCIARCHHAEATNAAVPCHVYVAKTKWCGSKQLVLGQFQGVADPSPGPDGRSMAVALRQKTSKPKDKLPNIVRSSVGAPWPQHPYELVGADRFAGPVIKSPKQPVLEGWKIDGDGAGGERPVIIVNPHVRR